MPFSDYRALFVRFLGYPFSILITVCFFILLLRPTAPYKLQIFGSDIHINTFTLETAVLNMITIAIEGTLMGQMCSYCVNAD